MNINFIMSIQQPTLLESLRKSYENRLPAEHKLITTSISSLFPTLTPKKIKLITFFLQLQTGPQQLSNSHYSTHSFIIVFSTTNNQQYPVLHILKHNDVNLQVNQFAAVLDYDKYLGCQALGETSIEKEVAFWESSQYFCSMPKRKFLQLIRQAKILNFSENQCPYIENQLITKKESGSGVYIVRNGQFSYYRTQGKQIETARFGSGHIFGALQLMGKQGLASFKRVMTVRCKTKSSIIYHFSETTFNQLMRHYCEDIIKQKQAKLMKFLPNRPQKQIARSKSLMQNYRHPAISFQGTSKANSPPFSTTFSSTQDLTMQKKEEMTFTARPQLPTISLAQVRQTVTTSFYTSTIRESERIEAEGLKKTTYLSLRKEGPLKNYPLVSQQSKFTNSQFKEIDKILANRSDMIGAQKPQNKDLSKNVWKRDMICSFYRQSLYNDLKRPPIRYDQ